MLRYKAAPESKKQPQEAQKNEKIGDSTSGRGQQVSEPRAWRGGRRGGKPPLQGLRG